MLAAETLSEWSCHRPQVVRAPPSHRPASWAARGAPGGGATARRMEPRPSELVSDPGWMGRALAAAGAVTGPEIASSCHRPVA